MSRSTWKGPFSIVRPQAEKETRKQAQKIWSRTSTILPAFLGTQVKIHNGKAWISVRIVEDMIGHKFGEFASTRKKTIHKFHKKLQQKSQKNSQKK